MDVPEAANDVPPAKAARIVNPVTKTIPLEYPVEFDGKVYTEISLRRMSGTEVAAYITQLAAGERVKPPVIDVPFEVYDALDDDDLFTIDKAVVDFFPRRFRDLGGSTPAAGEPSSA